MAKGWQAWHRYQRRAARAKRATSRAHCIISAHAPSRRRSPAKRRRAQFFSGSIFLHAVFNGDRDLPCCGPRCYSGLRAVRCRGSARAFAASLLHLSEKQRFAVGKVYLPVQRVGMQSTHTTGELRPTHFPLSTALQGLYPDCRISGYLVILDHFPIILPSRITFGDYLYLPGTKFLLASGYLQSGSPVARAECLSLIGHLDESIVH